jgi:predicted glycoside hydrolase/deacetylase ChbG (UPF0249 family)
MPGRNANGLLGYPDDARLLIVNADDFGMSASVNRAVLAAVTRGLATSASLTDRTRAAPPCLSRRA